MSVSGLITERTLYYLPSGVTAGAVFCHRDPSGCCEASPASCGGTPIPADLFVSVVSESGCDCLQATYRLSYDAGVWTVATTTCDSELVWEVSCVDGLLQLTGSSDEVTFFTGSGAANSPIHLSWTDSVTGPCSGSVAVYLLE
jgi:hypothetical protein